MLQHIEDSWDVMAKDNCVPVYIALQLMDHSSLGRGNDYQDFQRTSKSLQKALKAIVNGRNNLVSGVDLGSDSTRTPPRLQ